MILPEHLLQRTVTELRAFLGSIQYYGKFVPQLSTLLSRKEKWILGVIIARLGPVAYNVRIETRTSHVHVDHIIKGTEKPDICGNAEPEVYSTCHKSFSPYSRHTCVSVTPDPVEPVNVTPEDVPKPAPESPPTTIVPE